ncbi:hypothetical protein RF11_16492 [Thelohanellus kitauei]|uniref:Uncharacterized protein n=1 Tax=Thelohanellus kitauei TaxID=669202 RepID=A0A0C2NGQ4_THEKT|nr:hypothetical protein RF11_16492 [Thelohanellus kitauei]
MYHLTTNYERRACVVYQRYPQNIVSNVVMKRYHIQASIIPDVLSNAESRVDESCKSHDHNIGSIHSKLIQITRRRVYCCLIIVGNYYENLRARDRLMHRYSYEQKERTLIVNKRMLQSSRQRVLRD